MCENVEIRYVHSMEHPDYPDELEVGCICAEHMEEDRVGPGLREKKVRSRNNRRKTWGSKVWATSARGNAYLNSDGFNLTVFSAPTLAGREWRLRVVHRESGSEQAWKRRYVSEAAAKYAALDALLWAKEHLCEDPEGVSERSERVGGANTRRARSARSPWGLAHRRWAS
jgi:hypothetical protein